MDSRRHCLVCCEMIGDFHEVRFWVGVLLVSGFRLLIGMILVVVTRSRIEQNVSDNWSNLVSVHHTFDNEMSV